jgi:hypothetical protein
MRGIVLVTMLTPFRTTNAIQVIPRAWRIATVTLNRLLRTVIAQIHALKTTIMTCPGGLVTMQSYVATPFARTIRVRFMNTMLVTIVIDKHLPITAYGDIGVVCACVVVVTLSVINNVLLIREL